MPGAIPRSLPEFRRKARIHGGTWPLLEWGLIFYGTTPLLASVRARRAVRGGPRILFVTGTQGKSTATRALRHMLGWPLDEWSEFNNNVRGEVALTVLREPVADRLLPVEVSDGIGMINRYAKWLRPEATLVLNVGAEHLGALRDLAWASEDLAPAVARLPATGVAVLNADDPHVRALADRTSARVVWFGSDAGCDVQLVSQERGPDGRLRVELSIGGSRHSVRTQLVGAHYAPVVAGVIATAVALGSSPAAACARFAEVPLTPSRMEPFRSTKGATIISDDYKSTPETIVAGLLECAQWPAARRWAVLTDLTNLSGSAAQCHADVAAAASDFDVVVTTGPLWAEHTGVWREHPGMVAHVDTQAEAARLVGDGHTAADLIFVKGSSTHRVRRVTLALTGVAVGCTRPMCERGMIRCEHCPLLATG